MIRQQYNVSEVGQVSQWILAFLLKNQIELCAFRRIHFTPFPHYPTFKCVVMREGSELDFHIEVLILLFTPTIRINFKPREIQNAIHNR